MMLTTATIELHVAAALALERVRLALVRGTDNVLISLREMTSLSRSERSTFAVATMGRGAVDLRPMRAREEAISADVRAAASGDGEAYARIIRQYQGAIAGRMTRFARDPVVVEELVHDVFVEAYFGLGRYRGEAPLEHWLQRIATRVGYRYWKRRERERGRVVPLPQQIVDSRQDGGRTAGDDAAEAVAVLLEQLSPRDRLVLTLLYVESRSVAETAELAGWSQTMVKVQAHRARGRLRKMVSR